jgi:peptidoglycan hydrolase-like protein with peptidoglycan-binding domain
MRRLTKVLLASASAPAAAAAMISGATPAAASNTPGSSAWSANDVTGYCGDTSGGYVVAAQFFLYGVGKYSGPVDNNWGNASYQAAVAYQRSRGLTADGCIGGQTWEHMEFDSSFSTVNNFECGHSDFGLYAFTNNQYSEFSSDASWKSDLNQTDAVPLGGPVGHYGYAFASNLTHC